jgi:hypothetical protein
MAIRLTDCYMHALTSFKSETFRESHVSLHHLSVWPAICILSTTISSEAITLVVGVRSFRTGF